MLRACRSGGGASGERGSSHPSSARLRRRTAGEETNSYEQLPAIFALLAPFTVEELSLWARSLRREDAAPVKDGTTQTTYDSQHSQLESQSKRLF